jgi:hypothetical protein
VRWAGLIAPHIGDVAVVDLSDGMPDKSREEPSRNARTFGTIEEDPKCVAVILFVLEWETPLYLREASCETAPQVVGRSTV